MEQTKTIAKDTAKDTNNEVVNKTGTENKENFRQKTREVAFDVNIYSDAENFYLEGDMPGVDETSVDITFEKNVLTIAGKNQSIVNNPLKETLKLQYAEFRNADYRRSFQFNEDIDPEAVEAVVKNGVLRVRIPVKKPEVKKITVKVG